MAFEEEVAHWVQSEPVSAIAFAKQASEEAIPAGYQVGAPMHGSVWKVLAQAGDRVEARQVLLIIEAMKMEVVVLAPVSGMVHSMRCKAGQAVSAGDILAVIRG